MAISYQQVGAARDTGAQGLMQLGQTLQQQSQFQKQLEQAKLEFETNQKVEAERFEASYLQTQQQLLDARVRAEEEQTQRRIENTLNQKKYDLDVASSDAAASAELERIQIAKDELTQQESEFKQTQGLNVEKEAQNKADEEEKNRIAWAKIGMDPTKNKGLSLEEAARHKETMDGYLSEIKTLTSELKADGKEKNKKTYDKDLAKAEFKRVAYNKLADAYGTDKLKELEDTGIEISHAGFLNDYNIKTVGFEGKIIPYSGEQQTTNNDTSGDTGDSDTGNWTFNGEPISDAEYQAAVNAYKANKNKDTMATLMKFKKKN